MFHHLKAPASCLASCLADGGNKCTNVQDAKALVHDLSPKDANRNVQRRPSARSTQPRDSNDPECNSPAAHVDGTGALDSWDGYDFFFGVQGAETEVSVGQIHTAAQTTGRL